MENFMDLAKKRYSCRKFSEKPVPQEWIDQILNAAIAAPTAVNTQPFKLWVMASEEAQKTIRQVTDYHFGANAFIVVGARKEGAWTRSFDGHCFAEVDASIVATHIMLEIYDLGLATTWVGHFDAPELKKRYPQMADYDLIALFPVGYAAEDAMPAPAHTKRKSLQEKAEIL